MSIDVEMGELAKKREQMGSDTDDDRQNKSELGKTGSDLKYFVTTFSHVEIIGSLHYTPLIHRHCPSVLDAGL